MKINKLSQLKIHTVHDMMIGFDINLLKSRRYITMENVMANGFAELSANEMELVDGGGWKNAILATVGAVCVAWSPIVGLAASPAAGVTLFSAGCTALDYVWENT